MDNYIGFDNRGEDGIFVCGVEKDHGFACVKESSG